LPYGVPYGTLLSNNLLFKNFGVIFGPMKTLVSLLLSVIIILPACGNAQDGFVASKLREKYHYSNCRWAKKIARENLIHFKDATSARARGYKPCKVCRPPNASNGLDNLKYEDL
jgi:hypothetical protein